MIDFDRWFAQQGKTPDPVPETSAEPQLPEGVWDKADGTYWATCRSCERDYELPCDPAEFDPDYSYCFGSDRCVP